MMDFEIIEFGYSLNKQIESKMVSFEFSKALELIWGFISRLNQYIDKMEPWNNIKTDKKKQQLHYLL